MAAVERKGIRLVLTLTETSRKKFRIGQCPEKFSKNLTQNLSTELNEYRYNPMGVKSYLSCIDKYQDSTISLMTENNNKNRQKQKFSRRVREESVEVN